MKKSKLFLIILISTIIISLITIYMMYRSDMKRMDNGEPVKYSNWGYAYTTLDTYNQSDSMALESNDIENVIIDINYNKKETKEKNIVFTIIFLVFISSIVIIKRFRKK